MLIAGIDEAGRGPVIGPLVMAGVLIVEEDEAKLKSIGVKDSKLLFPHEREKLFEQIKTIAKDFSIIVVQPQEIDAAVNGSNGLNLNRLEAKKTAEILNILKPDIAIIDCPSNNIAAYRELLSSQLSPKPKKIILEHKADMNYIAPAAASILAKVTRDREIEKLHTQLNRDFGSGYLTDPKTIAFFDQYFLTHPDIFRKSWQPYQDKLKKQFQSTLDGFST
jgi:ribonuclease HII